MSYLRQGFKNRWNRVAAGKGRGRRVQSHNIVEALAVFKNFEGCPIYRLPLVSVSIEKIYQTDEHTRDMFHRLSKHLEFR